MNAHRLATTAVTLAMIAGAAIGAQQADQPGRARDQAQQPERRTAQPGRAEISATSPQLIPSSWAIGADVKNAGGDDLGDVNDLVLDASGGRITHALISRGGVLGVGGKIVALPWGALKWNNEDRAFTVSLTEDALKNAPEINKDRLKGERRAEGNRPFGLLNVRDDRAQRNAWSARSEYQDLVKKGRPTTLRGTVTSIDRAEPMQGMQEGIVITISENGRDSTVHLGPAWFIDRQDVMLRLNDQVEIEGVQADLNGDTVVVARTLESPHGTFKLRDEQNKPVWDSSADTGGADRQGMNREDATRPQTRQVNQPLDRNEPRNQNQPDQQQKPGQQAQQQQQQPAMMGAQGTQPVDEQQLRAGVNQPLLVSDIDDGTLRTAGREDLGDIEAVVFDAVTGKAAFLAVGVGGFLGIGETKIAIPWNMVRVEPDNRLMVNLDRDAVENAPRIEGRNWDELRDPNFVGKVYQHFGQPNPFQGAGAGMGPAVQGQPGAAQAGDQQNKDQQNKDQQNKDQQNKDQQNKNEQYTKLFTGGQRAEVTGTVRTVSQAQPMGMTEPILVVFIEEQGGNRRTVHVAPRGFLDKSNLDIKQGDTLTVDGRQATIDGEQVLIASRLQKDGRTVELRDDSGKAKWSDQGR